MRLSTLFFFGLGVIGVTSYHAGYFFAFTHSILIFFIVSYYLIIEFRKNKIGVTLLLLFAYYSLPFIHIIPYLWFDFNAPPPKMWGLVIRPYMLEEDTMRLAAMIGSIGAAGFAFSVSLLKKADLLDFGYSGTFARSQKKCGMNMTIWAFWVSFGVVMSWLAAPQESILEVAYTHSKSALSGSGLDSAWAVSYVVLSYAFVDLFFDQNSARKSIKYRAAVAVLLFVFLYLQFLRGDRAAVPWIFAIFIFYYYWGVPYTRKPNNKIPWKIFSVIAILLIISSFFIGFSRSGLMQEGALEAISLFLNNFLVGDSSFSNLLNGTWSAVLLTPMSVAGDDIRGILPMKWGQDYVNILLSVPPGFIADLIGYTRPLSANNGPAWEMTYGLGGTHASVVPFMNFRMAGVFIITTILGATFSLLERWAVKRFSVIRLTLLVTIALTGAHFMWYGEKYMVNSLIIWGIMAFFYRLSLSLSKSRATAFRVAAG